MNYMRNAVPFLLAVLVVVPVSAFAGPVVETFVRNIVREIIQPVVLLLFALALLFFAWGLNDYILKSDDPKERAKGAQHMLWGVIGFFIMASVLFILQMLSATFGLGPLPGQ